MANEADCEAFQPGEGEHLCWHILQNCDQDAEQGIDLRDAEIAKLKGELDVITCEEGELWELRQANARMRDNLASLSKLHSAERSKAQASFERELEQERQDRRQADLDTIRALGERNDERKLADRLALILEPGAWLWGLDSPNEAEEAIAAWKGARNETR